MKKTHLSKTAKGILFGAAAGVIDVIPMVAQNLTWDANLSAFSMWVVAGFLLATSNLKMMSISKGVLVSFLVLLPNAFLIGWNDPSALIPVAVMTLILGAGLGYLIDRPGK
jgi:hypothetical protein